MYYFAVVGNPCQNEAALHQPFVQPFDRRQTTLAYEAREVRCVDGKLLGATLSDHGFIIISMFFDLPESSDLAVATMTTQPAQPGRVTDFNGVQVQHEREYEGWCENRAMNGYNSGMGEIFRKVAEITPIKIKPRISGGGGESNVSAQDL